MSGLFPSGFLKTGPHYRGKRAGLQLSLYVILFIFLASVLFSSPARSDSTIVVAVLGDSLTAGYGLPPQDAFPVKLEAALKARGNDLRVLNAGVSGDTTAGALARIGWVMSDKPDAVIVELGGNDAMRGLDVNAVGANLDSILARLADDDIPVLLAGMKAPRNMGAEYTVAFDAVFPVLARKYNVVFYPFFLEGVATDPALNQDDMIHPNAKGVDVIVAGIVPSAEELLEQVRAARRAATPANAP